MQSYLSYFAEDYGTARRHFRDAALKAGASLVAYENPNKSPGGTSLYVDVAWLGPRDAKSALIVQSGTHGLEGYAGSACQVAWLNSDQPHHLPADVAVLLIHMINPYGVAWDQRETEEGVDLNRNFLDFLVSVPDRPFYGEIHEALSCETLSGPAYEKAQAALAHFRDLHGYEGYMKTVMGGQYHWPDGMNYGGSAPTWSNKTFVSIIKDYAQSAKHVAFLDFHTGLGPYGHASLISLLGDDHEIVKRARTWYGPSIWAVGISDGSRSAFNGDICSALVDMLLGATVTPLVVEYGTFDLEEEERVLRRDFWLRRHGNSESPEWQSIKSELRNYFYPKDTNWREIVVYRSQQVIQQGIKALAAESN